MPTIEVFEATKPGDGDAGESRLDPTQIQFRMDLAWLERKGVRVLCYNLEEHPEAFASRPEIQSEVEQDRSTLPLMRLDGQDVGWGSYPNRANLADWLGWTIPAAA
jgi:hypothetical protein